MFLLIGSLLLAALTWFVVAVVRRRISARNTLCLAIGAATALAHAGWSLALVGATIACGDAGRSRCTADPSWHDQLSVLLLPVALLSPLPSFAGPWIFAFNSLLWGVAAYWLTRLALRFIATSASH